MARVTTVRVPQEERSRAMRARLMDATIECLVEHGFGGTSTTLISERAGVSRGAQLHHFPTKNDLVVAAVEHLTEVRGAELAAAAAAVPQGPHRTRDVLRMLGDHFASPVFTAALELWVAARTDADAAGRGRAAGAEGRPRDPPDDRRAARRRRVAARASASSCRRPSTWSAASAWPRTITDDTRRRNRILDQWARTLDDALAAA